MKLNSKIMILYLISAMLVGCNDNNGILSNNRPGGFYNSSNDIPGFISSNSDINSSSDEINEYVTVTYDANGGMFEDLTSIKEVTIVKDSLLESIESPTKIGYVFVGWYYNNTLVSSGEWNIPTDCTLVAKWELDTYNIIYELNGGSVNNNPSTYNYEDETITLNNPTRVGYTFIGWTGENYDTPTLEVTIPSHSINNRTYVANWKANEYKVTFDVNGGNELETIEYTYTYDNEYILPIPTKDGYTFTGWYYNDTLVTSGKWSITTNCTLTAHYSANPYELILNNSDNDAGTITGEGTYDYGSTITIKATANEYYTFVGWYDLNDDCVSTDSEYTFTMELGGVLTAKWCYLDITINYIVDGTTVYTSTFTIDNHVTELYQYETDKCFYGWYKTNTFNSDDDKVTSTEGLKVENNNVYLYGTVLDANYSFKYENNGYTITKYNDTKEEIEIPSLINGIEVKVIGENAINNCLSLKKVRIPNTVTTLEDCALSNNGIESIILPNSINTLGGDVFHGSYSLVNVYYEGTIEDWCNITFDYADSNPMSFASHFYILAENNNYKEVTSIEIPSTITSIGNYQFYGFNNVTSMIIPTSVTSIGEWAFYNCDSLIIYYESNDMLSYDIPSYCGVTKEDLLEIDGIQYLLIGGAPVITRYVGNADNVVIPSLIEVNGSIFNIAEIGSYAFSNSNVKSITIPSSIEIIKNNAFANCNSLTIYCENDSEQVGWDSEWNPENRPVYYGVTKDNFIEKDGIEYLIIDGNAVITRYVGNADNVVIPSIIEVNGTTYDVTEIGEYAFSNSSIKSVTIPSSVTTIKYGAFCESQLLTSITLPSSIVSIDSWTFYNCNSLTNVYYDGTIEDWCNISFNSYESNPMYNYYYSLISHFYMLDENNNYKEVTSIEIPSTVTSIGNYQFYGFNNVKLITIPSSVISIGEQSFGYCSSLFIYCEASNELESWNWSWNPEDRPVYYGVTKENIIEIDGIEYLIIEGNAVVIKYVGSDGDVVIPSTIEVKGTTYNVTKINKEAFSLSDIKSITIPNSINVIENNAFSSCKELNSVIFEDNSKIETIGNYVFSNCSSLTTITIPSSVTTIGEYAFYDCTSLVSITIPSNVTSIGKNAFQNCSGLTSIFIPNSVSTMGRYVFRNCNSLIIYCEASSKPSGWDNRWNNNRPVYWANEWEYVDGIPVAK